jgi:hypothetical protein
MTRRVRVPALVLLQEAPRSVRRTPPDPATPPRYRAAALVSPSGYRP